jgi:hypothetical protein
MFKATFDFECDICGKKETFPRHYGEKLRVTKEGKGTFNLRPFFSWEIMELCFDRRYEMIGPHNEDMLTFKYAVCGETCHKKMDAKLANVSEAFHQKIEKALEKEIRGTD